MASRKTAIDAHEQISELKSRAGARVRSDWCVRDCPHEEAFLKKAHLLAKRVVAADQRVVDVRPDDDVVEHLGFGRRDHQNPISA